MSGHTQYPTQEPERSGYVVVTAAYLASTAMLATLKPPIGYLLPFETFLVGPFLFAGAVNQGSLFPIFS